MARQSVTCNELGWPSRSIAKPVANFDVKFPHNKRVPKKENVKNKHNRKFR